MSRLCQLTGAKPSFSASVSHGKGRSRRRWAPNTQVGPHVVLRAER